VSEELQVNDDLDLLDLMLSDAEAAPDRYAVTGRWLEYSDRFVSFLREEGLRNFRGRRHEKGSPGAVLASFGATDLNPATSLSPQYLFNTAASCFVGDGARGIRELTPSRVGGPEGFQIDGRFYTLSWLNYYFRYAFVSKHMRFDRQYIVEIGPGSGKQAEMLKKAHPKLTLILLDIPTQLYVCNQYLTEVFGRDQIVGYRECRNIESLGEVVAGKINILPHWKSGLLRGRPFDLFWNAASLQEMDPVTARGYIGDIASSAGAAFLMYNIKYDDKSEYLGGRRGCMEPENLGGLTEIDRVPAGLALRPAKWQYFDSFWKNAENSG
jgi:putative sugar O-methyltransferase